MWKFIHKFASPKYFYNSSGKILPPLGWVTLALFIIGLAGALFISPPDYQQGESVRILYIHVPAAMLSMSCYVAMAVTAAIGLIWRIKLADIVAWAIAPIGMTTTAGPSSVGSTSGEQAGMNTLNVEPSPGSEMMRMPPA
jgi:heme exporter protein C